jgi:1-acyl-sn-glycerol-3-phosphate acyltransferase
MALLKTQDALNAEVDITPLTARMTFLFFVPFLFAPLFGVLADRCSRRGLMVLSDVARSVLMASMAVFVGWTTQWGDWGAFAPLLLVGLFAAVFSPARSALLPTLVHPSQLVRANALLAGLGIIATMAAAKLGGMLADRYEPFIAFRIDAGTFLASAGLLLLIRGPVAPPAHLSSRRPAILLELLAGFHYARRHRHVLELLAIASLVWFCGGLVKSSIPAVVRDVYHGTYAAMSNYLAFLGLGFVIGSITMTVLGEALRSAIAMTWGLFGISVSIAVCASSVFLPLSPLTLSRIGAVGVTFSGVFGVAVIASFHSLLQRTVANRFRGRVFGVHDVCSTLALLLSTGLLGLPSWERVDRWVGWILAGVAVFTLCAGLVTLFVRLRRSALHRHAITFAANINEFLARFWWRMRRVGPATVPRTGPVIVTSNHTCPADPSLICAAVPYRVVSFMIAAEYADFPVWRSFLRMIECIPVRRGAGDMDATKQALRHLREGKALGIFIEGGIVAPGEEARPKDGVASLALRTGATVIPAYISGVKYHPRMLRAVLSRHRAQVRFGQPVDLSEFTQGDRGKEAIRAATRKIYAAVLGLAPNAMQTTPESTS